VKSRLFLTLSLSAALLSGCARLIPGDFCQIAKPDVYASEEVIDFLILNDREHIERDLSENEYGKQVCGDAWATT